MSVIYIESDFYLKDITTFSQYIMNLDFSKGDFKLITILGEFHNLEINCDKSKNKRIITVDQYLLKNNLKKKIIIETDEEYVKTTENYLGSKNMELIINIPETQKEAENIEIVYIDYRYKFLVKEAYHRLYGNPDIISILNLKELYKLYIDPFYLNIHNLTKIENPDHYSPLLNNFTKFYIQQLINSFDQLRNNIKDWDIMGNIIIKAKNIFGIETEMSIKNTIIQDLRSLWARVSDYFVIKEFFKLDDTKEYIVLIGEYHYRNIISFLELNLCKTDNFAKIISKDIDLKYIFYGLKIDCLDIKNTANIININEDSKISHLQVNMKKLKKK